MLATNQEKKWLLKQIVYVFRENYYKTTWKKSIYFSTHFFEMKVFF